MEVSIHFFHTVLAPWWEGTGLSCLSQALGRNSFQGCSPGSRERGQHLPTRCNPKSRAWAGEEPRPRWFWEGFLGCSAALWWLPATCASSKAQGLSLGRSSARQCLSATSSGSFRGGLLLFQSRLSGCRLLYSSPYSSPFLPDVWKIITHGSVSSLANSLRTLGYASSSPADLWIGSNQVFQVSLSFLLLSD